MGLTARKTGKVLGDLRGRSRAGKRRRGPGIVKGDSHRKLKRD
jgi:hypothetical protein